MAERSSLVSPNSIRLEPNARTTWRIIYAFFFLSGAISLVYQVAWVRMLSLFFGSDVYSAATTLSVFMGGLALGSWLAGRLGDRTRRPLTLYGALEVLVALTALAVPHLLQAFHDSFRLVYLHDFATRPWLYHAFKALVAMAVLLPPTTLMGATLPLLVRRFAREMSGLGRQAGRLYAANTLGALCGTLAAGFLLLPYLGVSRTVHGAVGLGLAIGLGSILLGLSERASGVGGREIPEAEEIKTPATPVRRILLLVMALSGMAALALEVVWMRILVQSFSATVYAFSIMLACFLFGIYYGSAKASEIIDRHERPLLFLARLQLGLGLSVAALALVTYVAPLFFGRLVWILTGATGGSFSAASVIAQFFVASILILVPTIMLGAMFPSAVRIYTVTIERRASGTGAVYAANTAGAIFGALLGGFLLLPTVGTRGGLLVIALVFALNGLLLGRAAARETHGRFFRHPATVAMLLLGAAASLAALLLPRQTIANYGLQGSTEPQVLYHGDGVSNTVDIVKNDRGVTIMMINGNIEADTSLLQRRHFILKAYLPLLLEREPKDIAVVGLGLGITLAATARYPSVERIRLIELSPDIVAAHRTLAPLTGNILQNPKVHLRIDDGRNFMAMSDEKFDMITADPVHPRITGVGYLYTREYYRAIASRLGPGGVVTQWMPMYNISPESFDVAFRTFAEVFPNASFWYVRGHGLFVATEEPMRIGCANLVRNFNAPAVKADFASIGIASPADFLGYMLMDEGHIARYLARNRDSRINTDDNAYLEYRTPFEFTGRTDAIVPDLIEYAGWDPDRVFGADCGPELLSAAGAAFQHRLTRIIPELGEPIR